MERVLSGPLDPTLRRVLAQRRDQLVSNTGLDLAELVHIIVAQRGDTLSTVEEQVGFSLATEPPFEWVQRHERWLEAVIILSDDGFSVALFVRDCITSDAALLHTLLAHT